VKSLKVGRPKTEVNWWLSVVETIIVVKANLKDQSRNYKNNSLSFGKGWG